MTTVEYASPELKESDTTYASSDIWSLAKTFAEAIRHPVRENIPPKEGLLTEHTSESPKPVQALGAKKLNKGDRVAVMNEESRLKMQLATVLDPDWNCLVKVEMDKADERGKFKSFAAVDLEPSQEASTSRTARTDPTEASDAVRSSSTLSFRSNVTTSDYGIENSADYDYLDNVFFTAPEEIAAELEELLQTDHMKRPTAASLLMRPHIWNQLRVALRGDFADAGLFEAHFLELIRIREESLKASRLL
jgi:serine/threonine protein kinase